MKPQLRRRARMVRVRNAQQQLATRALSDAQAEMAALERNAARLDAMRGGLGEGEGVQLGADIAARRELDWRLRQAADALQQSIAHAQKAVSFREQRVLSADRDVEIAERLKARMVRTIETHAELRMQARPHRVRVRKGGVEG